MNEASETATETTVNIDRVFEAPVDVVFKAFTDPDQLEKWWGPHTYATREWTIDLRTGGDFRYCMYALDGSEEHWCSGTYSAVWKNTRLTSSANIENPKGPGKPNIAETTIDIQFLDEGGRTRVLVTQSGLPSADWKDNATQGWNQQFDKFDKYLATPS